MTETQIKERLQKILKPSRYEHTLGVVTSAVFLTQKYYSKDESVLEKIRLAALLHDCAKNYSAEALLRAAEDNQLELDAVCKSTPELLHGPVGAVLAEKDYGISDEDILNAIRYHTTGRPGMSFLEKIIYLADYIEPGRTYPGAEALRKLAESDFDEAIIEALSNTIMFVAQNGGLIHPDTVLTRNEYLLRKQQKKCKINQ